MANLNSQTVFQQEIMHLPTPEREGKLAQLIISYRSSIDGSRLTDDYTVDLKPGQYFSVTSPRFQDFYTNDTVVEGTMPDDGNDLSLVVFYEGIYDEQPTLRERFQQSVWYKPVVLAVAAVLCVISMRSPWSLENILRDYLFPTETVVEETSIEEAFIEETPVDEAQEYILRINYVVEGGSYAFPSYTVRCTEGSDFSVSSPVLEGYSPSKLMVAGRMPGSDYAETVMYYRTTSILSDPAYTGNATIGGGMNLEDIPKYDKEYDEYQPVEPKQYDCPFQDDYDDGPTNGAGSNPFHDAYDEPVSGGVGNNNIDDHSGEIKDPVNAVPNS